METIFVPFSSVSPVRSAAEQPISEGALCVYRSAQSGQEMGGRVKAFHHGMILFRETYPLRQMPAGWEPAQFLADPANIFPAI